VITPPPDPPPARAPRATTLRSALLCFVVTIGSMLAAAREDLDVPAWVALALIGALLVRSRRLAPSDAVVASLASVTFAGVLGWAAFTWTGVPLVVEPRYVHGGGPWSPLQVDAFYLFALASITWPIAYAAAHRLRARTPLVAAALARSAPVALLALAPVGALTLVRSLRAPPAAEWVHAQPVVFDSAQHADWVVGPLGPDAVGPVRTTLTNGITITASPGRTQLFFPSGVEASIFAGPHLPLVVRRAERERLWIVTDGHMAEKDAVFEDGGQPAGDLHLERIAGRVAPPRSCVLVLLLGLALASRDLARTRERRARASAALDPYRASPAPAAAPTPVVLSTRARAFAIACLASAPVLGWWFGALAR
jgi:hypothetical protein